MRGGDGGGLGAPKRRRLYLFNGFAPKSPTDWLINELIPVFSFFFSPPLRPRSLPGSAPKNETVRWIKSIIRVEISQAFLTISRVITEKVKLILQ